MMAEFPALPLFTDAYIADTMHLTTQQHGAYMLLLMAAWRDQDCSLPNDDVQLSRMCRLSLRQWQVNRSIVLAFWRLNEGGRWTQGRLLDELEFLRARRRSSSAAGKASAKKRENREGIKSLNLHEAHPTGVELRFNQNSTPTPTPTLTEEKGELTLSQKTDDVQLAFDEFCVLAQEIGLPVPIDLSTKRRKKLAEILSRHGLAKWRKALNAIRGSEYLAGANDKGWCADIDFVLQPDKFNKLLEGSYGQSPNKRAPGRNDSLQSALDDLDAFAGGSIRDSRATKQLEAGHDG